MNAFEGKLTIYSLVHEGDVKVHRISTPPCHIFPVSHQNHRTQCLAIAQSFTRIPFSRPNGEQLALLTPLAPAAIEGQHTWKKNLTMKTCSPAMQTIIKLSITLKLKILLSVLLTVLKFRFSLVRKYFWFLVIVESSPEILKIDSSNADVCSGDVPCLEGIEARCSFSTWFPGGSANWWFMERRPRRSEEERWGFIQRFRNRQTSPRMCSSRY